MLKNKCGKLLSMGEKAIDDTTERVIGLDIAYRCFTKTQTPKTILSFTINRKPLSKIPLNSNKSTLVRNLIANINTKNN